MQRMKTAIRGTQASTQKTDASVQQGQTGEERPERLVQLEQLQSDVKTRISELQRQAETVGVTVNEMLNVRRELVDAQQSLGIIERELSAVRKDILLKRIEDCERLSKVASAVMGADTMDYRTLQADVTTFLASNSTFMTDDEAAEIVDKFTRYVAVKRRIDIAERDLMSSKTQRNAYREQMSKL